ncbi:CBS domain containing-hemolysin-like protein [Palleronia aestuarii]|uniref:CBS domain containing-hemolysin-like protein n=1 Tax=Palleronia aestuarii TaxID=568105 RepID=A0A2W7P8T6_9RHOB|nr:hemolysin family protein [Palleronia aestuarii]PZX19782.1 CBS domain containing-hemolysin-like protein [Palleronia aestuarii]
MIGLGIIAALIAINGIFVAMEFVIVGSRLSRVETVSDRGARIAGTLQGPEAQDRYVAVAQLGITFASIGLGMYGEHKIAGWIEAPLANFGIEGAAIHVVALILAVIVLTYFHVVLGEMIPKAMALKGAERLLVALWPVIRFFELIFRPFVAFLNVISQALLSIFGLDRSEARFYSPRELAAIAEDSHEGGAIGAEQAEFIKNIVRLQARRADELMTPRRRVLSIDLNQLDDDDFTARILDAGPSRLPVTRGGLDASLGVVHVKDVIRHQTEGGAPLDAEGLEGILRPLPKVLASLDTAALLDNMRQHGTHMALVVDEFGSVLGAVAFEDAIEEVVGEVHSEFEIDEPDTESRLGRRWKIAGTAPISRLNERFDWGLDTSRSRSIAGLLLEHLGRPPREGDQCEIAGLRFEVEVVEGLAIARVGVEAVEGETEPDPGREHD